MSLRTQTLSTDRIGFPIPATQNTAYSVGVHWYFHSDPGGATGNWIISMGASASASNWDGIGINAAATAWRFWAGDGAGNSETNPTTGLPAPGSGWHYSCLVRESTTILKFYHNGVLIDTINRSTASRAAWNFALLGEVSPFYLAGTTNASFAGLIVAERDWTIEEVQAQAGRLFPISLDCKVFAPMIHNTLGATTTDLIWAGTSAGSTITRTGSPIIGVDPPISWGASTYDSSIVPRYFESVSIGLSSGLAAVPPAPLVGLYIDGSSTIGGPVPGLASLDSAQFSTTSTIDVVPNTIPNAFLETLDGPIIIPEVNVPKRRSPEVTDERGLPPPGRDYTF